MNKRRLSGGVKKLIIAFSVIVLAMVGSLVFAAISKVTNEEETYIVSQNCVAYDNAGNRIILEADANVYKSWSNEWILKEGKSKLYSLGKNTVIFDDGLIKVFGDGYQILSDSEVKQLGNYNEITNLNDGGFFKLADRRYLMTGSKISSGSLINTGKYLFIVMDKAGNAMLLNDENCKKTKNATILDGTGYQFDIANEKLIFSEDKTIDLKKIIGSTNEYDPSKDIDVLRAEYEEKLAKEKEKGEKTDEKNPDEINLDLSGGKGGTGGTGGTGGSGGTGGTGGVGGAGGYGSGGNEVTDARKTMNIYKISPSYTSAIVNYHINDPFGQLGDPYFNVYEVNTDNKTKIQTQYVDVDGSDFVIYDLVPGAKYYVELCQASQANNVMASQYFSTKSASITIDEEVEISEDYLLCTVRYVEGLSFSSANIAITSTDGDGNWIEEPFTKMSIPLSANSIDGVQIKFVPKFDSLSDKPIGWNDISLKGKQFRIYFTDVIFNSKPINISNERIINNPYYGKSTWDTFYENWVNESVFTYEYYPKGKNGVKTNAPNSAKEKISKCIAAYKAAFGNERSIWDTTDLIGTLTKIYDVLPNS